MSFLNFGSLSPGNPTNLYLRAWGDSATTETSIDVDTYVVLPYAGILRNLAVYPGVPGAGADVLTCTVQVNGVDTALVVAHTESAASSINTTDTITVAAGDLVRIKVSSSGSISGSQYRVAVDLQPITAADLAVTLDDVTLASTATTVATADLAVTLDDVTLDAVAFVPAVADLAATLDDVTLTAEAFTPFVAPPFDHAAEALDRLALQWRGEAHGSGLVTGQSPAAALAPPPAFEIPVLVELDHTDAALDRLAQQWRSDP